MNSTGQPVSSYNPTAVIAAAHAKLSAGDWEGGQFIFQSSLLEWTDDAREAAGQTMDHGATATNSSSLSNDYAIPEQQREAVATLWLAYAQYLIDAKQYKSATQAYADATASVVARRVGRVHAAAARYALERSQRQTARRIYQNALVGDTATSPSQHPPLPLVDDEQDRDLLWQDFLDMMRVTKPELTMAELQSAVMSEAVAATSSAEGMPPAAKRFKETHHHSDDGRDVSPIPNATTHLQYQDSTIESQTHVVTLESVQELQNVVYASWVKATSDTTTPHSDASLSLPPDVRAAWMSRDGHALPLEPPAPSLFRPAPPKLSDPVNAIVLSCKAMADLRAVSLTRYVFIFLDFYRYIDIQGYLGIGHGHTTRTASAESVGGSRVGSVSWTVDAAGLDRTE
jgi:hypothetical protein